MMEKIRIYNCSSVEMGSFMEFISQNGWNVGLSDSDFAFRIDPSAYIMALKDSEVAGTIAAVRYGSEYGFIGYHVVRSDMRGRGIGKALFAEAMRRLGSRSIGLNCYEGQVEYYKAFGFSIAHSVWGFEGEGDSMSAESSDLVSPFMVPFDKLQAFDRRIFPYDRKQFLSCWHAQPKSMLMGKFIENEYRGYGMFRPCRYGYKVGPLLSEDAQTAKELLTFLVSNLEKGTKYYMDVPAENLEAMKLAEATGMRRSGELVRMYSRDAPSVALKMVFSLPAVEIG